MLLLRSYWLALLLLSQEVCYPRRLVDPASLADWRCSYLCSKLIPSVTEKSVIFIKELSSHRRRQLMMPFSTGIGLERVGVVGLDLD